jgi:pseudouridine-5'-phosphate glycosidase
LIVKDFISIQPEVAHALAENKPVVALESTIIAHGMPFPENIRTAREVEDIVRMNGAIPATIAILKGKLCVGLDAEQLELLGKTKDVWKVSLRDMPFVTSRKIPGATTVAATLRIASLAGIKFFVTGGIGGVHRGAENSMDISADLFEMAQTSVAVVSAGIKSILDIGLTLEYLETHGVPVITFGQDEFPAFYSRSSKFISPLRLDDAASIAEVIRIKWQLGIRGSVLVANPLPEAFDIPFLRMESYIDEALREADNKNISGKKITPYLLKTIAEKTGGESLASNIALVKNNAALGAQVAVRYHG